MRHISQEKEVSYSPSQLFALVRDVPSYPEFIPWCPKGEIRSEKDQEVVATIHIQKGPVSQSFTTQNTLEEPRSITMRLLEGPFSSLSGKWHFDPTDEGCRVKFDLSFEFANPLFDIMAGKMLEEMAAGMVGCFCERAHALYGTADATS